MFNALKGGMDSPCFITKSMSASTTSLRVNSMRVLAGSTFCGRSVLFILYLAFLLGKDQERLSMQPYFHQSMPT